MNVVDGNAQKIILWAVDIGLNKIIIAFEKHSLKLEILISTS